MGYHETHFLFSIWKKQLLHTCLKVQNILFFFIFWVKRTFYFMLVYEIHLVPHSSHEQVPIKICTKFYVSNFSFHIRLN